MEVQITRNKGKVNQIAQKTNQLSKPGTLDLIRTELSSADDQPALSENSP